MEYTNMYQALNSMGSKCFVPKDITLLSKSSKNYFIYSTTLFSMKNIFPAETIHVVCKPAESTNRHHL